MSSDTNCTLFDDVKDNNSVEDEGTSSDSKESDNEGYFGSDRSDVLDQDESECSFGSDIDFENYVKSSKQDLKDYSNHLWSKIDLSDENLKKTCFPESNLKNKLPELKNCPPRNSPPDSYFDLFFTVDVWNHLTNETNKFANTPNRLKNWVDVTVSEMKKYFALILNMGVSKTHDFSYFWKKNSPLNMSFYSSTMPLERFKSISSKLHMSYQPSEKVETDYNSWIRFRPLLNALNSSFINFYVPAQDITLDESVYGIVPKYKSVFVSYSPKHHTEFGLKKYDLCDSSTGYTLQSSVLSRTDFTDNHINPFMQKFIFSLISEADLLHKWHHLLIFNAYPKLPLVKTLLEQNMYVTANVNKKTKELPKQIGQTKLNVGETVWFQSDKLKTVIIGYKRHKKSRYMVTSLLEDAEKVKERTHRKTAADEFAESNPYLDAVDDYYKAVYDITCTRCTTKYWRKILYNLVDVTVLNSYILYKLNTDKPISKLKFITTIIHRLVGHFPQGSESEDDESNDFEESESSGLSDFLMSDTDSTSDTKSEEDENSS